MKGIKFKVVLLQFLTLLMVLAFSNPSTLAEKNSLEHNYDKLTSLTDADILDLPGEHKKLNIPDLPGEHKSPILPKVV